MKLGIFAPYDFSETTRMACALADTARARGLDTTYLTQAVTQRAIHGYWDKRVRSCRSTDLATWAAKCDIVVWFDLQDSLLRIATAQSCVNVAVPRWHRLHSDTLKQLQYYEIVAATSRAMYQALSLQGVNNITHTSWYGGPRPHPPHPPAVTEGRLKFYIPVSRSLCEHSGTALLSALHVLLSRRASVDIVLSLDHKWHKHTDAWLTELAHTGRVQVVHRQSREDRIANYSDCDWSFCLDTETSSGHDAIESLVYGCPVAAFDVSPFDEILNVACNGALLRVDGVERNSAGAPSWWPDANTLLGLFDGIAANPALGETLKRRDWRLLTDRAQVFHEAWQEIWDC